MVKRIPSALLFPWKILNLVHQVYLRQEMRSATSIEMEGIKYLLLRRDSELTTVKVCTLLCRFSLQLLQLSLISTPLVCNELATFKTTNWYNHCAIYFQESCYANFTGCVQFLPGNTRGPYRNDIRSVFQWFELPAWESSWE